MVTRLLVFIVMIGVLSGCARTRPVGRIEAELPSGFPGHAPSQIQSLVERSADSLRALRVRAALSLSTPERSGRFSADIRERRDDSLYISLSPGLGIEAARVLVTPDSVFLYDRMENQLTYGAIEEAGSLLPIPVDLGSLFQNLAGTLVPRVDAEWRVLADSTTYQLLSPDETRLYVVDPRIWRVIRYEERTLGGQLIEERIFSAFAPVEGIYVPQQLRFRRPFEESTVALTYRRLEVNPDGMSFDLNLRSDTRRNLVGAN